MPMSPMEDKPTKPSAAKQLNMEGNDSKLAGVSINSRTAKRKQSVLVFGNIIDIWTDKRGVTMYEIKFDDGSTESVTWSTVWLYRMPVYNQFKDLYNGCPVETDNIPEQEDAVNPFLPSAAAWAPSKKALLL